MTTGGEESGIRRRVRLGLRLAVPIALAGWRLLSRSPSEVWRDPILILSLLDLLSTAAGPGRLRTAGFVAASAFLLGIYVSGQGSHTLRVLGLMP